MNCLTTLLRRSSPPSLITAGQEIVRAGRQDPRRVEGRLQEVLESKFRELS